MTVRAYEIKVTKNWDNSFEKVDVSSPSAAEKFARQFYFDDLGIYESMFAMFTNRANEVIAWVKISQGGVAGTISDPVLVAKYAIDVLATGVILCHNHPSGNKTPSEPDKKITKQVNDGLRYFNILLLDHIILTEGDYFSMADEGLL